MLIRGPCPGTSSTAQAQNQVRLSRMDDPSQFWPLFWSATTAAATVATAISTGAVFLVRWRARPEPDWAVFGVVPSRDESSAKKSRTMHGDVYNAGDGAAFRVTVEGHNCKANVVIEHEHPMRQPDKLPFVALVEPGDGVRFRLEYEPGENWRNAALVITWIRSPTRLGKRRTDRIPLREIVERPHE